MEKKIELSILQTNDIKIEIRGEKEVIVKKENMELNAQTIFNLLNFSLGDIYSVVASETDKENPAIFELFKLFNEIAEGLNSIPTLEEQENDGDNSISSLQTYNNENNMGNVDIELL